jgi:hypothetical protein
MIFGAPTPFASPELLFYKSVLCCFGLISRQKSIFESWHGVALPLGINFPCLLLSVHHIEDRFKS